MQGKRFYAFFCAAFLFFTLLPCGESRAEKASDPELNLYAQSAVLMDAASGRILYEKNGQEQMAMASTTKIMTLIVTLENANLDDVVTVSDYAATMPDVQLNIRSGEHYRLRDLVYSLMLESHNDSAVAIAEHVAGSVDAFARMMNEKAVELGCEKTCFITPNGLDATAVEVNSRGETIEQFHSTTAAELARIMSYCILESPKRDLFLEITRTPSYYFSNLTEDGQGGYQQGGRSFSCSNHNAFLNMMEGALSGKTGFTGKAGYCYVGALESEGRTYVVALLACGWPSNKSYKWSDTRKLMAYGMERYQYHSLDEVTVDQSRLVPIPVADGQTEQLFGTAYTGIAVAEGQETPPDGLLMSEDEAIRLEYEIPEGLSAPVAADTVVGSVRYYVGDTCYRSCEIVTTQDVPSIDFKWTLEQICLLWLL